MCPCMHAPLEPPCTQCSANFSARRGVAWFDSGGKHQVKRETQDVRHATMAQSATHNISAYLPSTAGVDNSAENNDYY